MSRTLDVLKNKNKVERAQRARRKEESAKAMEVAAYKAALSDELKIVDVLLHSDQIDGVVVKLDDKQLVRFTEAIYSEDLSVYDIVQVPGKPDEFIIRPKLL